MKILYAANNFYSSEIQFKRIKEQLKKYKNIELKYAAYKNSSKYIESDYNLDCLKHFLSHDRNINFSYNDNIKKYINEIEKFAPDLIISDLDIPTSLIAKSLNIQLWQVSSLMLNWAIDSQLKNNISFMKNYFNTINSTPILKKYLKAILDFSSKKYIYSYFTDYEYKPQIDNGFEWIRPYYMLSNYDHIKYDYLVLFNNRKDIMSEFLRKNSILFGSNKYESFNENISDYKNYKDSIGKSKIIVSEGDTSSICDAIYNEKKCIIYPNINDLDCLLNYSLCEHFEFGYKTNSFTEFTVKLNINNKTQFIHEKLEEYAFSI